MNNSARLIDHLNEVKSLFNCSAVPKSMVCREEESAQISKLLSDFQESEQPFALYVYGLPGTGKTSSVMYHINDKLLNDVNICYLNCSTLSTSIFEAIFNGMSILIKPGQDHYKTLVKSFTNNKKSLGLIILDEIDSIKNIEKLNLIYELPAFSYSRVSIIGISNDLTLANSITNQNLKTLNFKPYSFSQLVKIIQSKLKSESAFESDAIQLCARKAATMGGDLRKTMSIIQASIDNFILEKNTFEADKENIPPEKMHVLNKSKISKENIINALKSTQSPFSKEYSKHTINEFTLPTQHQIVFCCIITYFQENDYNKIPTVQLFNHYMQKCSHLKLGQVSESDFFEICQILDSYGIVEMDSNKHLELKNEKFEMAKIISRHLLNTFQLDY